MQDSLHFTTPKSPLLPTFSNPNFPSKTTTSSSSSSFHHPKPPLFPSLSSKSTTISTTLNPPKIPPLPFSPPSPTTTTTTTTTTITTISKPQKIPSLPLSPPTSPVKPPKIPSLPQKIPSLPPKQSKLQPLPPTTTTPSETSFQSKALFLDSLIGLDTLSSPTLTATIAAATTTVTRSDIHSLLQYLLSLSFTPRDLRRLISMNPQVLSLRHRDAAAVFSFLLREAAVPATHLCHVIHRRPRLLTSSVPYRLRPTMYFLNSIGIHEVKNHTHLLSCSVEDKFMPKIEYFQNLGFSYRDVISMFRRFPPLFCYSVKENFEPKFSYFVVEMGRELRELKEFPQYFSFSLERRIKPRHQRCVENGVCLPLNLLLKMKEEEFRERLEGGCDSAMPKSSSPLWCANHCDVGKL